MELLTGVGGDGHLAGQKGTQRVPAEMASWIWNQRVELIASLQPKRRQVPSYATLRRLLTTLDLTALEKQVAAFAQELDADQPVLGRIQTAQGDVLQAQKLKARGIRA